MDKIDLDKELNNLSKLSEKEIDEIFKRVQIGSFNHTYKYNE